MTEPRVAPFGSWTSPITADLIVAGSVRLGQIALDGGNVYWTEGRPSEAGRTVLVRHDPNGTATDLTPAPYNVRTRVHEYGGGPFAVSNGTIVFAHDGDQRLHRLDPSGQPRPLTPESGNALRYADPIFDWAHDRLICVREDHTGGGEAVNALVAISLSPAADGDPGTILVSGADFYSFPRLSPDGTRLAWLSWNHPNMPWDGCDLSVADLQPDASLGSPTHVAGGLTESIFQPQWAADASLVFVSDRTGWWNLYRWQPGADPVPLHPAEAEFGLPLWVFGMSTYGIFPDGRVAAAFCRSGVWSLALLDPVTGSFTEIDTPYDDITGLRVAENQIYFQGASPTSPAAIVRLDLASGGLTELRRSTDLTIDPGYLSVPRTIEFPTEGGRTAFGFFYPPRNQDFTAPAGERPPLLVISHGGPTGATSPSFSLGIQYWTSRGIGVLDVNYGGSTGYGRAYRERLEGTWGIVDVDDCTNGALWLAEQGAVDRYSLAIRGGSAGGYTTLAALTFRDVFAAGASHFGISDLETMTTDTHKFESRYLDRLIGPYPERKDVYVERSPIHFTDRLACPLILFQGLEDKVVPPDQAEVMFAAVKAKGLPVAYVPFEGEQHGFRKAENIKRSLEAELYFYGKIFEFTPADQIEPVAIENI